MKKYFKAGQISSWILLTLAVLFLLIIVLMGSGFPATWGMLGAFEKSDRCLQLFRLAVITAFLCLPAWTIIIYCIKKIRLNSRTANAAFILSLAAMVCVGIAYVTELFVVSPSLSAGSLTPELRSKLITTDGKMFLLDNIGYFFMGLSSLLIIPDTARGRSRFLILSGLLIYGLSSVLGLISVLLSNSFLSMLNLIGMGISYPLTGCAFLLYLTITSGPIIERKTTHKKSV
ncbi:MAG: hypothetical protein WCD55_04050 [Bacteroidales bacterium]